LKNRITIGIDAANIRLGGGITHLAEILKVLDVESMGIDQIVIWGCQNTLGRLPNAPWLKKISPAKLNDNLISRVIWQTFSLSRAVTKEGCDILLVPGGSYFGSFHPVVTISQNLLPVEWGEMVRNQSILMALKMIVLRYVQGFSFKHSDGVIFLTEYAKSRVCAAIGASLTNSIVIPHGQTTRFCQPPRQQKKWTDYSINNPLEILYVSNIDVYKHQIEVLEAIHELRLSGLPLKLTMIGPAVPSYYHKLLDKLDQLDTARSWAQYLGVVQYEDMSLHYKKADIGIFASSCETFGIILLEKMAAGLPIACSNKSSMPEILQDGGVYFDPANPRDIAKALKELILSDDLRAKKSLVSYCRSGDYSWSRCADETFSYILKIAGTTK